MNTSTRTVTPVPRSRVVSAHVFQWKGVDARRQAVIRGEAATAAQAARLSQAFVGGESLNLWRRTSSSRTTVR